MSRCVLLLLLLCGILVCGWGLAVPGDPGHGTVVAFPDSPGKLEDTAIDRDERAADSDYEDDGEEGDGPEARHFHRKLKRKLKHKFGHGHGGLGCRTLHGCGGFGGGWQQPQFGGPIAAVFAGPSYGYGHGHGHGHVQGFGGWNNYGHGGGGFNPGYYGGGGWNPGFGGGGGGGWNSGYTGYNRPGVGAHSQAASFNFGPFQGAVAQADAYLRKN